MIILKLMIELIESYLVNTFNLRYDQNANTHIERESSILLGLSFFITKNIAILQ